MTREGVCKAISSLKGEVGHKKVLEVYNSQDPLPRGYRMQEKDPWCAATVTAVLLLNGYSDIAECSCVVMTKKAKDLGIWQENDGYMPNVGDIVMYDWQDSGYGDDTGTPDHVGVVIAVSENGFVVREGNKNKTIGNRTLKRDAKYIRGFIIPPYENKSNEPTPETVSEAKEEPQELHGALSPSTTTEAKESQEKAQEAYVRDRVYTVNVRTALNVRKGPGKNYGLVGYKNLTADGKKHAYSNGALKNGTRVTVIDVETIDDDNIWIKIPSGWICAVDQGNVLVK